MDSNSDGLLEFGSKLPGFSYREGVIFCLPSTTWALWGRVVGVSSNYISDKIGY